MKVANSQERVHSPDIAPSLVVCCIDVSNVHRQTLLTDNKRCCWVSRRMKKLAENLLTKKFN